MAQLSSTKIYGDLHISNNLKINSNTLVSNLNADLLDGFHASTFAKTIDITEINKKLNMEYGNNLFGNDINNWKTFGTYGCIDGSTINLPPNKSWGSVFVYGGTNDRIIQIYNRWNSSNADLYVRQFDGNTWGTWKKIYHEGNKPTPLEIGALPLTGGIMTGIITTPNGTMGILFGDDVKLGDVNIANTLGIQGNQDASMGGIVFGNGKDTNLYRVSANHLKTDDNFTAAKVYNAVYNDYAEWFEKENINEEFEFGDIVSWNKTGVTKSKEENSRKVIGVISDTYGHIVGGDNLDNMEDNHKKFLPIGLSGRVSVKVTGKAEIGDLIVSSDIEGVGMVNNNAKLGTIIGKVIENKNSMEISKIKIFIINS